MADLTPIKRALISVTDKTDLVPFARRLVDHNVTIISTGGTAKVLVQAGIPVTPVEDITHFPEMMDGRLKTLHPAIHGGLLALRDQDSHVQAMKEHDIEPIDLVCVNLYPFERTAANPDAVDAQVIEQIDIGGPSMIRSASKNYQYVTVVTDVSQYDQVSTDMDTNHGATSLEVRRQLAAAAFARTAAYDTAIARWMASRDPASRTGEIFPDPLVLRFNKIEALRYGENPHQTAALYAEPGCTEANVVSSRQLHGKQLSFNNLNDAAAALELVKEFITPAVAVIKHTNPCGLAVGESLKQAFERAYAGDPLAAFGGIVALNRTVDEATAQSITEGQKFLEVILAPDYTPEALELLQARWKTVRLLATGPLPEPDQRDPRQYDIKRILGGLLTQQRDMVDMSPGHWQHIAGPSPSVARIEDLLIAWIACKHVKSNAIVLAKESMIVGTGAGQMDRVESCKIAIEKANVRDQHRSQDAVAASDAFFPFRDGPDTLIKAGVKAIVQPGGSKRDDETIAACNEAGVSLMFTGKRHFRH